MKTQNHSPPHFAPPCSGTPWISHLACSTTMSVAISACHCRARVALCLAFAPALGVGGLPWLSARMALACSFRPPPDPTLLLRASPLTSNWVGYFSGLSSLLGLVHPLHRDYCELASGRTNGGKGLSCQLGATLVTFLALGGIAFLPSLLAHAGTSHHWPGLLTAVPKGGSNCLVPRLPHNTFVAVAPLLPAAWGMAELGPESLLLA